MARPNSVHSRLEDIPEDQKIQQEFAIAAFSTLKSREMAYISVPISSGKRLYDYMEANHFKTMQEAQADHDAFLKNVVKPNLADGIKAGNSWTNKIDGPVLTPARFEKQLRNEKAINWGENAFMGMWIPLIESKITHMVMVDGWQYSNGSGEEYLQAALMEMGRCKRADIQIVDQRGLPITLDQGITLMADAFKDLTARGLQPQNMAETLGRLLEAEHRYNFEQQFKRSTEPDDKVAKRTNVPPYNHAKIDGVRKELQPIFKRDYPYIMPVLNKTSSFDYSPINDLFDGQKKPGPKPAAAA